MNYEKQISNLEEALENMKQFVSNFKEGKQVFRGRKFSNYEIELIEELIKEEAGGGM